MCTVYTFQITRSFLSVLPEAEKYFFPFSIAILGSFLISGEDILLFREMVCAC